MKRLVLPVLLCLSACGPMSMAEAERQCFERARFEYHPENPAPYDVLLGQLGRQLIDVRAAFSAKK